MTKHSARGFTLVELAISLMVIGLLIGGILKGQELVENARVTRTIRQVQAYRTALTTFRATYSAIPGDMVSPGTRLPGCTTAPCSTSGDGNRFVYPTHTGIGLHSTSLSWLITLPEQGNFWLHMQKANLITGVDPNGGTSTPFDFGTELPDSPVKGMGFYAHTLNMAASAPWPAFKSNVIVATAGPIPGALPLKSKQASQIDSKMDDGRPFSGSVFVGAGTCQSNNTASAVYNESDASAMCELYFDTKV